MGAPVVGQASLCSKVTLVPLLLGTGCVESEGCTLAAVPDPRARLLPSSSSLSQGAALQALRATCCVPKASALASPRQFSQSCSLLPVTPGLGLGHGTREESYRLYESRTAPVIIK
jgi:hypothetical protein